MSNNLGQIYATYKSSNKYIVLESDNIEVSGNLEVQGDASFNNVDISGNLEVQGDFLFNSNVDISGILEVQGDASFGNVNINGNLEVQGDVSLNSNVDISGILNVAVGQDISCNFGTVSIGYNGSDNNNATFAHKNNMNGTDYALRQTSAGATYINAKSSKIFFRTGNSNTDANQVTVKEGRIAIGRTTATTMLDIQQTTDAAVSSNTNVSNRGNAIKIRNKNNTSNWNIAIDNDTGGSELFLLNENEQGGVISGNNSVGQRFQNITFTGQHRSIYKNMNIENDIGLIVVSNNQYLNLDNTIEPTIDESLPIVVLANTDNNKQVFGVVSNIENQNYKSRIHNTGRFASYIQKYTVNERRVLINSVGEGAVWVCNKNGTLENGDYITSSSVIGYGVKQQDDILHNYTVAKITCSCDFDLNKIVKQKVNTIIDGDSNRQIVYTTDGDIEYVDDLDSSGNIQMVYKYDTRFLDSSGNIVEEGSHSYIACFVGCTYHCG